jgi:hypothetical protein
MTTYIIGFPTNEQVGAGFKEKEKQKGDTKAQV